MPTEVDRDKTYWGNYPPYSKEFASEVVARFSSHLDRLVENEAAARAIRTWCAYHSRDEDGNYDNSEIEVQGEDGVVIKVSLNEFRNFVRTKLNIACGETLTYQATSLNDDSESINATLKSQTVLRHYQERGGLGVARRKLAEGAEVMSAAWMGVLWDHMAGQPTGFNPVSKQWQFPGDLRFPVFHFLQVAYDTASADIADPNWIIVQMRENRFELAKRYPKYEDKILEVGCEAHGFPEGPGSTSVEMLFQDEEDYIRTYLVFFKPSILNPVGRMARVLDDETVIFDGDSPYSRVPFVMMRNSEVIGESGMPYGDDQDVLPACKLLQDAQSSMATGMAQATPILWTAEGSNYDLENVGYFKHLKGGTIKPEALTLFGVTPEMYQYAGFMLNTIHRLAMIPDAMTGNANAADSGSKLAFQVSTGMEAQKDFTGELNRSMEVAATLVIEVLRTHMDGERVISIVGKRSPAETVRFSRADLKRVNQVLVKVADPLMDTPEGRRHMADQFAQNGWVNSVTEWITAYLSGTTDVITGDDTDQHVLIKRENELLLQGGEVHLCEADQHKQHIGEHVKLYLDDSVRTDPMAKKRVDDHVKAHLLHLTPGSDMFFPQILLATGQQPLPATSASGAAKPPELQPPNADGMPAPAQGSAPKRPGVSGKAPIVQPPNMPNAPKDPGTGSPAPTPALSGAPVPPGATS